MRAALTDVQYGIYTESINDRRSTLYNIPMIARLKDDVDIYRLRDSILKAEEYHPILKVRFHTDDDGSVYQETGPAIPAEVIELSDEEFAERRKHIVRRFDLNGGPLSMFEIYITPSARYLYIDIHHAIYDGTSYAILGRCLTDLYEGKEPEKETVSFKDISDMEHSIDPKVKDASLAFYDGLLSGSEPDSLPPRDSYSDIPSTGYFSKVLTVDGDRLRTMRKTFGFSNTAFFTSAFGITIARFDSKDGSTISVIHNNRSESDASTVMMLVRTHPFVTRMDGNTAVSDILRRAQDDLTGCYANTAVSFMEICQRYSVSSEINFAYQGNITTDYSILHGHEVSCERIFDKDSVEASKIIFEVTKVSDDDYRIDVTYRADHYTEGLIAAIVRTYGCILKGMLTEEYVKDISLLDPETEEMLDRFNDTDSDEGQFSVLSRLEDNFRNIPERNAVVFKDRIVTYSELDTLSSRIASYVIGEGISNNEFVSILLPRSEMMTVAAIGVIRSGAAYMPIDPSYPKERIGFMMKDANVRLIITDRKNAANLDDYKGDILFIDEIQSMTGTSLERKKEVSPGDAFIILYTSGTTGVPKGCILEHRNISSYVPWVVKRAGISQGSHYATYASFGFDANMLDTYSTLCGGGTLYIIPEEMRLDPFAMDRYFTENGMTHGMMTTQVGRQFLMMTQCRSLRHFILGGEKLVPFIPPSWVEVHNMYGPTETTVSVTEFTVKDDSPLLPIGRPNTNVRLYIADGSMRRMPVGALGELCIAGPQVSRGYLNRPDKTAESFIPNPFDDDPVYSRMYRTGDIVRMLPDGNVEYIGRNDGQVKIRGFRIELTEVERIIREFNGIKDATVSAFDSPSGGKFIAAYIVSDEQIDIDGLNSYIRSVKPPYMVPAVTMQIDSIPLTVNGKVDRRRLPKPEVHSGPSKQPENDIQKRIFKIVSDLIGSDAFGIDSDLQYAGLNSILTIKLIVLLSKEFNVDIQINDIRENGTVELLERCISLKRPAETFERLDDYPLSKIQEGIFSEMLAHPDSTVYNIPALLKIDKGIDLKILRSAIVTVMNAHPQLRTVIFLDKDGNIRQRCDGSPITEDVIEIIETENIENIKESLLRPFEIIGGRLFRICIIEADERYLFIDIHHIICDGTSLGIILNSISEAYSGKHIAEERCTGFDAALIDQKNRGSKAYADSKAYYEGLLSGCETDILPKTCLYEEGHGAGRFSYRGIPASGPVGFCDSKDITMNGLICSAFGFILSKFCGTSEPTFTTVYNGRNDSRLSDTVSMLVKTIPVRCNVKGNTVDYIRSISQQLIDTMSHDTYSFAEIAREYSFRPDIMLVYQSDSFRFDSLCGKKASVIPLESDVPKCPISVTVSIADGHLEYQCEYDRSLYDEGFMCSMVRSFDNAISSFMISSELCDVIITDDTQISEIEGFNDTDSEYDECATPYSLLKEKMDSQPERDAIVFKDTAVTYGELDDLSGRIASFIKGRGLGRGDFVSILSKRNEMMTVTSIGVMRSGAAYQPLDPSYPKERLSFMVHDAGVRLIIAERELTGMIEDYSGEYLYMDEIRDLPSSKEECEPSLPSDPMIIMYTSGTTGKPKGCAMMNGNLTAFLHWATEELEYDRDTRTAAYSSFGFDPNMMDTFATLCNGGTMYIIPEEMRLDLMDMDRYLIDNGITHCIMTTQVGRQLAMMTKCKTLRQFGVGGEKLVPFEPPAWLTFRNMYGPTETTILVSSYIVKDDRPLLPIGTPNTNVKLYVVDPNGHQLPIGAIGELYAAGPQVAFGYLNRPEKTAEAFIRNPFCDDPKYERAYRTGDTVRRLPDGNIEFIGRNDGQVKIRGFRVELTEVEKVIRGFSGIKDATVTAFDSPAGGKYLAAYVVSDERVDINALIEYIRSMKPPYMVPSAVMQIDRIPLNVNSKVDKRKLPIPTMIERKQGELPSNETEKRLCDIFASVLGLNVVYADDNFFDIGGTSISASKLLLNCMNSGLPLVYKNIFDNPTPKMLAEFLSKQKDTDIERKTDEHETRPSLTHNRAEYLDGISREPIGDVLLTGATGFLGMHVLAELLERKEGRIACLVRDSKRQTGEERLRTMLMYYFGGIIDQSAFDTIEMIKGDISDKDLSEKLKDRSFDTIINCAAVVKHFAFDDSIERVNYYGVKNLIDIALEHDARLITVSTTSVAGESVNGSVPDDILLKEDTLDIGQNIDNKYVNSKYRAEDAVLTAIENDGLRGKIFRAGNLMSRESDGEFQINFNTNSFIRSLRSYNLIGCFPVDDMDAHAEFTPVDAAAKALVLLAGTPDEFTVFHGDNCHYVHMANIIESMHRSGMGLKVVDGQEFNGRFREMLDDSAMGSEISGLLSYMGNEGESRRFVGSDNTFTVKALYRLGFSWPIIDNGYIDRVMRSLGTLRFFEKGEHAKR